MTDQDCIVLTRRPGLSVYSLFDSPTRWTGVLTPAYRHREVDVACLRSQGSTQKPQGVFPSPTAKPWASTVHGLCGVCGGGRRQAAPRSHLPGPWVPPGPAGHPGLNSRPESVSSLPPCQAPAHTGKHDSLSDPLMSTFIPSQQISSAPSSPSQSFQFSVRDRNASQLSQNSSTLNPAARSLFLSRLFIALRGSEGKSMGSTL